MRKYKEWDTENYNFDCCFVWAWNLVSHIEGGTQTKNRRICWPKRDEVTGEWRKLHNDELNDLYSSPNIIRVVK